eukprot:2628233-Rhodomonas_salina.1
MHVDPSSRIEHPSSAMSAAAGDAGHHADVVGTREGTQLAARRGTTLRLAPMRNTDSCGVQTSPLQLEPQR